MPLTSTRPCLLHTHRQGRNPPFPLLSEEHHVLPVAWQQVWRPLTVKSAGVWDPRTVPLCPTSHRNVHTWLPRMMKLVSRIGEPDDVRDILNATRWEHGIRRPPGEFFVAADALHRWRAAGGRLLDLVAVGQYGYGLAGPS